MRQYSCSYPSSPDPHGAVDPSAMLLLSLRNRTMRPRKRSRPWRKTSTTRLRAHPLGRPLAISHRHACRYPLARPPGRRPRLQPSPTIPLLRHLLDQATSDKSRAGFPKRRVSMTNRRQAPRWPASMTANHVDAALSRNLGAHEQR